MKHNQKMSKMAYQIGIQEYALMNDRAFCNCQKIKREKTDSDWEAWNNCWEEYKEAYNGDPDKWIEAYISNKKGLKSEALSDTKKFMKENFIKDVEHLKGSSKYSGASIRNVLRSYASKELKEKTKKS